MQSYGRWLQKKKEQDIRAQNSLKRDEAIKDITKALMIKYEHMDKEQCHKMAIHMVMNKNQAFIDALELNINVSDISEDVTLNCEIVDKEYYREEALRIARAKQNDYSEF